MALPGGQHIPGETGQQHVRLALRVLVHEVAEAGVAGPLIMQSQLGLRRIAGRLSTQSRARAPVGSPPRNSGRE